MNSDTEHLALAPIDEAIRLLQELVGPEHRRFTDETIYHWTPKSKRTIQNVIDFIATERAAREATEVECARLKLACDQFSNDEILQGDLRKRAETAEARLAEATAILTKLSTFCVGEKYKPHGFGHTPEFIGCSTYRSEDENEWCGACEAIAFLSSATPPAIPEELRLLKVQIEVADKAYNHLHERHQSAESRLQIAREALKEVVEKDMAALAELKRLGIPLSEDGRAMADRCTAALAQITDAK